MTIIQTDVFETNIQSKNTRPRAAMIALKALSKGKICWSVEKMKEIISNQKAL